MSFSLDLTNPPHNVNQFGQPVGLPLPDWNPCPRPPRTNLEGKYCRLEPLQAEAHAAQLYEAFSQSPDDSNWTYTFSGPFPDAATYYAHAEKLSKSEDPIPFAIIDLATKRAVGSLAYLRIDPNNGVIEMGQVNYSDKMKQTRIATEAQYLMMKNAFETLGYRRYEWKCDSFHSKSQAAALRLGFTFEGVFRQAIVYKGRTRDTAWFAIIDKDWPVIKKSFECWLSDENFDENGRQKERLEDIRKRISAEK